ncbi:interleukin-1 receptor-like 1 isoform X2 [Astyanax mexicanus]|uniref:interleukin-1 receptor-like 1 isoform X2 n=1 Tax=Astyanax mexicanus TaxID=7994 RepID=UPI0020CAB8CB|nr:interleukin-1 receptor-like 1 isoform X2 [Astyanax mexicanus]
MEALWMIIICSLADLTESSKHMDGTVPCATPQVPEEVKAVEGEALYWPCPNSDCSEEAEHSLIQWFKNSSGTIQPITADERARVHHHGPVLYILPLTLNDSGLYITRWWEKNKTGCDEFKTELVVGEKFHTELKENSETVPITCPAYDNQTKSLTWYKDSHLIPNESKKTLYLHNTQKKDEGMYTCVCTWEHHGRHYNTSGSIHLEIKDPGISSIPKILHPSNNSVKFIDLGSEVVLQCSVFFGINIKQYCFVDWLRNNAELIEETGYTIHNWNERDTFYSSLTISKVSEADLQSEFQCKAYNLNKWVNVIITLKTTESDLLLVVTYLCTFLIVLLVAGTIKWFAVDLALLFRGLCFKLKKTEDGKVYDAYVIYQKDNVDEKTANFINRVLPAVLENSCGFKLYIHCRDDLPGEDCMEQVERVMKLCRRLIVVLTPGISQGQQLPTPHGYDWQVGLYQVLVQQEMSMILIQLGKMKDYSHLPLALQHHLQKTPPLKWSERSPHATSASSRFWKQVRYMMPAVPALLCPNFCSAKIRSYELSETCC